MLLLQDACPCGSGLPLEQCCLLLPPPITRKDQRYGSIKINVVNTGKNGRQSNSFVAPRVRTVLRNPRQIDLEITRVFDQNRVRIANLPLPNAKLQLLLQRMNDLYHSLHGVRYHQREFLYRLRLLTLGYTLEPNDFEGNTCMIIDDMPLRFEFEAYLVRVLSSLDVQAKMVSVSINKRFVKNGELYSHLKKSNNPALSELISLYAAKESWVKEVRRMRDEVAHDGGSKDLTSFSYEFGVLGLPTVGRLTAENKCFSDWKELISFVEGILQIIIKLHENNT